MSSSRIFGGVVAAAVVMSSASALAAPAVHTKVGKFDVYADAARVGKPFNTFTDGARQGKFDPYTDGAKMGTFDVYTDGARGGQIAASSVDNSRAGDGTLYGYRV
ncbi:hypothetical protein L602_001400000860 [Cupriavidus gilardii J11]|uniref:Uncharacterized protein n=1 Tax=Cupriavidus gilardii J11 TaxID=936133 RepID=A0A562BSH9_9BURK|nr:hypothetical protein [Cupriavidus gilardii]TWG88171.1 hypothetical protein L602_001400000860 [Cupriavidus gilardii J11]